jgi:hypothetical protein
MGAAYLERAALVSRRFASADRQVGFLMSCPGAHAPSPCLQSFILDDEYSEFVRSSQRQWRQTAITLHASLTGEIDG